MPAQAPKNPLDKAMRLLRAPMPHMPDEAIRADLRDQVIVDILFNEAGDVESVVPKSDKHTVLPNAALAVARDRKIESAVEAGKPVKITVRQAFRFRQIFLNRLRPILSVCAKAAAGGKRPVRKVMDMLAENLKKQICADSTAVWQAGAATPGKFCRTL